jgi:hypothetical protein
MNALVTTTPSSNVEVYRASTDAAGLCKEIVVASALTIQGRKYVRVEGWQAIAIAHGCTGSAGEVEKVEGGVRAVGQIRRMSDGSVIAEAEGFVGEDEPTWFGGKMGNKTLPKRPDYAIRAMAQTRAISRACRSAFAHVVVMMNAGLSTTPAEEVPYGGFDNHSDDVDAFDAPPAEKAPSKASLKRSGIFETLRDEMDACLSVDELEAWNVRRGKDIKALPKDWYDALGDRFQIRREELLAPNNHAAEEAELDEAFRGAVGPASATRVPGNDGQVATA